MKPSRRRPYAGGVIREATGKSGAASGPSEQDDELSPLVPTALLLVGSGATATDLVARFAGAGAALDNETARQLLGDLARLGLTRVGTAGAEEPRFVPTSLGQQLQEESLTGGTPLTERLSDLERLRTDLLSTIAHQLRTPLTAIRTCIGLLRDPETIASEEQGAMLLATIERNADRMQRLIGDILDLARFRAGQVGLQLRRFDATALARGVAATVTPLAEARGQAIEVHAPPVPVWVYGDHRRLEQALLNLVANAQQHSPEWAPIIVRVAQVHEEVHWSVTDIGPGIAVADQARLFERFFVGASDRGAPRSGVGLGLPTALAIAQAHGGRIDVDSVLGDGSTFVLVVPVGGPSEGEE